MSNTIPPFRPVIPAKAGPQVLDTAAGQPPASQTGIPAAAPPAPPQTDSVTLSEAAQSGAQLLNAAQKSTGIDAAAVANIRAQLAGGSYNVSPEDLAQAIATVLKETKS